MIKRNRDTIQSVVSGHWHKWFEFGRCYGPQHLAIAATRYDANAHLIVDLYRKAANYRLCNLD